MKLPHDQLKRAATKVLGRPRPRALRRYVRLAWASLVSPGLPSRMSYGDDGHVQFALAREPFRCDKSIAPGGRDDPTKGWWAIRARSEFGGLSTLLYTPSTGMVEGFVRLR